MSEQIIIDGCSLIGFAFLCLVNGMFLGCGTYAFACQVMKQAGFDRPDHEANQTEADTLWAPVKVRAE